MHDYSYSAHLVINDGHEDRLDMKISCQNAQQLLRARDSFSDQMNTYIAEFAMQSNLVRMPSDEEQNTAALQAIIQEQTEKAKQQAPTEDITGESDPQEDERLSYSDIMDAVQGDAEPLPPPAASKPPFRQDGIKGLMKLRCPGCGDTFLAFSPEYRTEWNCKKCGTKIPLDNTALFEYDCSCGRHTFGRTNIEDADLNFSCGDCGKTTSLKWNPATKKYME